MTPQPLLDMLDAVLRGEAPLDLLLDDLAVATSETPHAAEAFLREVEAIYARNEMHFDLYLRLKDQVQVRHARTTRPPGNGRGDATVQRSDMQARARQASPAAPDRSMLRPRGATDPSATVRNDPGATVGDAR